MSAFIYLSIDYTYDNQKILLISVFCSVTYYISGMCILLSTTQLMLQILAQFVNTPKNILLGRRTDKDGYYVVTVIAHYKYMLIRVDLHL